MRRLADVLFGVCLLQEQEKCVKRTAVTLETWAKNGHITGVGEDVRPGVMAVEVDLVFKNSLQRSKILSFLFFLNVTDDFYSQNKNLKDLQKHQKTP